MGAPTSSGELNNVSAMRLTERPKTDLDFAYRSLAISVEDDDTKIHQRYRPFLLPNGSESSDWVSKLELATVTKIAYEDFERTGSRLKVLVLYGSLRQT